METATVQENLPVADDLVLVEHDQEITGLHEFAKERTMDDYVRR
jgi:hypothetical protein